MKKGRKIITVISLIGFLAILVLQVPEWWKQFRLWRLRGITRENKISPLLWAHRVNSPQRFDEVTRYFEGIEMDIVFDPAIKKFRVYHPPAEPGDYLLDEAVKSAARKPVQMWLDVKSILKEDWGSALISLDSLNSYYKLKQSTILEFYSVEAANYFVSQGYRVSFNIPVTAFTQPDSYTDSLKNALNDRVEYVSQEDIWLPGLKQSFPEKKIITWALSSANYINRTHLDSLLKDRQIHCILINFKTSGYK